MYGYVHGTQASKKRVASWAAATYPQWAALITNALSWREAQWKMKQKRIGSAIGPIAAFVSFAMSKVAP